jgi:hypothetical protein
VVIFSNDFAICVSDIFELIHQKQKQAADFVCAMDYVSDGTVFNDSWIVRNIYGELFVVSPLL